MEHRIEKLEILLSEQASVIEDLHHMVAKQDQELAELKKHVRLLLQRVAEAEAGEGGVVVADQKPPHW